MRKRNELKDMRDQFEAERKQVETSLRKRTRYGVFDWRGDGRYDPADAYKVFKTEFKAQKYADTANAKTGANLVVRSFITEQETKY